jgi:hypothetical protein
MKSFRFSCIFLLGIGFFATTQASDFEAALSRETAQFTLRSDSSMIGWGGADLAVGLFFNDDSDIILDASLMQMRQASEENPLTFGVGVKGYLGQIDNTDESVFALAIGGEVRYTIPGTMPMAIYGRAFYAPEITSFSDAENVLDYSIGFQIEVLPQTIAFVGLRHFEIETKDAGDYNLDDDNIHIGVRLTF